MKRIGLLSDTHGFLDEKIFKYFDPCDEVWHAGDIGDIAVADRLEAFKPFRSVYGNIDGKEARIRYPKHLRFHCEEVDVWITHIGGYPGRYAPDVRKEMTENPPRLFICGHSHMLKVMYDKKHEVLHMNPGAAGRSGFHKVRTLLRFSIDRENIRDLEVIELGPRVERVSA